MTNKQVLHMADQSYTMLQKFKSLILVQPSDQRKFDVLLGKLEADVCSVCLDQKNESIRPWRRLFLPTSRWSLMSSTCRGLRS